MNGSESKRRRKRRGQPRKVQLAVKEEAELRQEEGRQENVEMKMRTYVRFVEVTMMMMTKRHRKGGLDVMKGVVGDGTTTGV